MPLGMICEYMADAWWLCVKLMSGFIPWLGSPSIRGPKLMNCRRECAFSIPNGLSQLMSTKDDSWWQMSSILLPSSLFVLMIIFMHSGFLYTPYWIQYTHTWSCRRWSQLLFNFSELKITQLERHSRVIWPQSSCFYPAHHTPPFRTVVPKVRCWLCDYKTLYFSFPFYFLLLSTSPRYHLTGMWVW